MIHNITRNSAYNYSIPYEKTHSKLKDWGGTKMLVEKNDADNDVYCNAVIKATMIAEDVRYSQGTFDLSMLISGVNTNSYFTGKLFGKTFDNRFGCRYNIKKRGCFANSRTSFFVIVTRKMQCACTIAFDDH